jgi:hypothetical protein
MPESKVPWKCAERERRIYGTPDELSAEANPTLKRGANYHCAYGAGGLLLMASRSSRQSPLRSIDSKASDSA